MVIEATRAYYDRESYVCDGKEMLRYTGITLFAVFENFTDNEGKVTVTKVHIGISQCHENDQFNRKKGREIASGRARYQQKVHNGLIQPRENFQKKAVTIDMPVDASDIQTMRIYVADRFLVRYAAVQEPILVNKLFLTKEKSND